MFQARLSHATIVAYLALFVALGGTAIAATSLPANSVGTKQLVNGAVTTAKLRNQAVTGAKINVSTLGTVPNAAQLGGAPASSYLAHCPTGLLKVPNGSLCFDANERAPANFADAANTCALAGLHLPSPGELIQAFNDLGAGQDVQWTSTAAYTSAFGTVGYYATALGSRSNRQLYFAFGPAEQNDTLVYRCVTYASN